MLLLNFSHPITDEQILQVEGLTGKHLEEVRSIPVHFDQNGSFIKSVDQLVDDCNLFPEEWQTRSLLIIPPALNFIAVTLLAELHGRMGYFPPVVRIRQVPGSLPPRYEVAEIIDLQAVRDNARRKR